MQEGIGKFIYYLKEEKKVSANTLEAYKRDLYKFGEYLLSMGITDATKVTGTNINSYVIFMEKNKSASSSISRTMVSIKSFFTYLHRIRRIEDIPGENIKPPKVEKKVPKVLTVAQINSLLEQPKSDSDLGIRDKAMLELLYATGMRVSELINLKLEDVNLDLGYVACGNRIVPFGSKAKNSLKEYINNVRDNSTDMLFSNCHGGKMSRQGFWKIIKKYANSAKIDVEITPHTLRHSFAVHMVSNGADLRALQEMLGHSDIATTQMYSSFGNQKIKDVYDKTHPRK